VFYTLIPLDVPDGDTRKRMEFEELANARDFAGEFPGLQATETRLVRWLHDEKHLVKDKPLTSYKIIMGDSSGTPGLLFEFMSSAIEKAGPLEAEALRRQQKFFLADRIAHCKSINNWKNWPGQAFRRCFDKGTGDRADKTGGFVAEGNAFAEMERLGILKTDIARLCVCNRRPCKCGSHRLPCPFELCLRAPPTRP
jgi:hypothetical protein